MFSESDRRVVGAVHEHRLKETFRRNLFSDLEPRADAISAARTADFCSFDIDFFVVNIDRFIEILDFFHDEDRRHHFRERSDLPLVRFVIAGQYFSGIGVNHHESVGGRDCEIRHFFIAHRLIVRIVDGLGFDRIRFFRFHRRNCVLLRFSLGLVCVRFAVLVDHIGGVPDDDRQSSNKRKPDFGFLGGGSGLYLWGV